MKKEQNHITIENNKKLILRKGGKEYQFCLTEIKKEELVQLRKTKKPIFILKIHNTFYYAIVNIDFNLFNNKLFDFHLCNFCKKCQPSKCAKVHDREFDKRIEKYDFVETGAETNNMSQFNNSLAIKACRKFSQ